MKSGTDRAQSVPFYCRLLPHLGLAAPLCARAAHAIYSAPHLTFLDHSFTTFLPSVDGQVQAEQYLFALVLHAIRTRLEGSGRGLRNGRGAGAGAGAGGSGSAWGSGFGGGGPSACPRCGGGEDPG